MKYGKRLFPYPTLNAEKILSHYVQSQFSFKYDVEGDETNFILKNAHYILTNEYLQQLINDEKAVCLMLVECPITHFRKLFTLTPEPQDVIIPTSSLSGKTNISCYIMAKEDINPFTPSDLNPDYEGFNSFIVDKYDVIAIDDGYVEKVSFDEEKDNIVESIFTVIGTNKITDEVAQYALAPAKITISIPQDVYTPYKKMAKLPDYKWLSYSLVLIPALIYAVEEIQKSFESVDAAKMNYSWFESICNQYKNIYGLELDDETLKSINACELAQKLIECPNTKALSVGFDLVMGKNTGGDDDE